MLQCSINPFTINFIHHSSSNWVESKMLTRKMLIKADKSTTSYKIHTGMTNTKVNNIVMRLMTLEYVTVYGMSEVS